MEFPEDPDRRCAASDARRLILTENFADVRILRFSGLFREGGSVMSCRDFSKPCAGWGPMGRWRFYCEP